jgi:glyoxylase-like metal-dependent hydrolase (beta-lactamase superfamily II)
MTPRTATSGSGPTTLFWGDYAYAEVGKLDPDGTGTARCEIVPGKPVRLSPRIRRITAPNAGMMTGPGTNTYVIGPGRALVIDPGPDDDAHLQRVLAVAGGRVERIVCTHSHPDHSPGAAPLHRMTGAPVMGRPAPLVDHQDESYAPHVILHDDDRIAAAGRPMRVLHTPGHASNHVCLLLEPDGLLFTGDHLMQGSTVVILPPDGSMKAYLDSLDRLQKLPLQTIAPGHGALIPRAHEEIARVVAHRLKREAKVVDALARRGSATLDDLLPEVYDDVPASLHDWARYSLLAHTIKLVDDGRATVSGETYRWLGA